MRHSHLGVYGLIVHKEQILLILKARGPYTGLWDLPGGSVEFGESPAETLTREVAEETGLHVCQYDLMGVFSTVYDYTGAEGRFCQLHHLGVIYSATVQEPNTLRHIGDALDAGEARWVLPKVLPTLSTTPFVVQALAAIRHK